MDQVLSDTNNVSQFTSLHLYTLPSYSHLMLPSIIEDNVADALATHYDVADCDVVYRTSHDDHTHLLRVYEASSEIDVDQLFIHAHKKLTTVHFSHWYNGAYVVSYLRHDLPEDEQPSEPVHGLVTCESELAHRFKGATNPMLP